MLLRFRVSNFRSLRDEQELSLVASLRDGRQDLVRLDEIGVDALRCAAIYGANASGKTNVLLALALFQSAVAQSHRRWGPEGPIPRSPFALDPACRQQPTELEADLEIDGVRYRYGFRLDDDRVLGEWLYAYAGKRRLLFVRDAAAPEPFTFGKQLRGNNRTIAALTRKNSLFLSAAAENNHAVLGPIYSWITERILGLGRERVEVPSPLSLDCCEQPARKAALVTLLRRADLGIVDVTVRRDDRYDSRFGGTVREALAVYDPGRAIEVRHRSPAGTVALPFFEESHGTQAWFSLAGPLLGALDRGGVLCLDELDASLHPRLSMEVVRIFQDPERNPHNAQLIFTTHDTTLLGGLLGEPALHRDQIWFTEKDTDGTTRLYPLTDFKPRKMENLERGYLQGRYGAVPLVGWEAPETDG